ncbi:MAG TPA: hypothetical protein VME45_09415 [Stellaceae bacterium]|nr:hypothetical protein [Stellaceae bacterium]
MLVLIEKKWGARLICNDGVTIAKEFGLKHPEENLDARMLLEAARKPMIWFPMITEIGAKLGQNHCPFLVRFWLTLTPSCHSEMFVRTDRW